MSRHPRWVASLALIATLVWSFGSAAQESGGDEKRASVEDRAKAAEAYDEGITAYLSRDYVLAAHWFERAYRLVPTPAAILQAVRAYHKAGDSLRAANLALELRDDYPNARRAREASAAAIGIAKPANVLVKASCDRPCTLDLDGTVLRHSTFFTTADVEHSVTAAFDTGEVTVTVQGTAGEIREVELRAPLPPPPPPVPRWAFFSSLGATIALGAVTVWSGIDANDGVEAYESAARTASSPGINDGSSPTPAEQAQALLEEGQSRERRTNILIGVTAAMAASTAVLGVFTNWKAESRETAARRIQPSIGIGRRGGAFAIEGRF